MTHYGITEDYEYNETHKRQRINVWSGPFGSQWEAEGMSTKTGYVLRTYVGERVRVVCPSPRDDDNFAEVDSAINRALSARV